MVFHNEKMSWYCHDTKINKHGEEEGTKRYWEWRKKQSTLNAGKNNPNYKHGKYLEYKIKKEKKHGKSHSAKKTTSKI